MDGEVRAALVSSVASAVITWAMLADRASVHRGLDLDLDRALAAEFEHGLAAVSEGVQGARRFIGR